MEAAILSYLCAVGVYVNLKWLYVKLNKKPITALSVAKLLRDLDSDKVDLVAFDWTGHKHYTNFRVDIAGKKCTWLHIQVHFSVEDKTEVAQVKETLRKFKPYIDYSTLLEKDGR